MRIFRQIRHRYMPPKKILFVITQSDWGGTQRFLEQFLSRLDRNAYHLTIAVGPDGDGGLTTHLQSLNLETTKLKHLRREAFWKEDLLAVPELRRLIKKVRPETLFLNSSKAGFIGSLASIFPSRLPHLRIVYRIGGWTFNDPWPAWKKKLWIILERISASWKDIIITNNQHDFDQAKKLGIKPREKVVLVHNGLDPYKLDFFSRAEARLRLFEKIARSAGKIFQTKFLIGTIANFYPAKGLENILAAVSEFKDQPEVAFIIIGDGAQRLSLEKYIVEHGLEKKIFLLGKIDQAYRFLTALDIFVCPSLKEGFPWSVLEAMAAKIPIIASAVGALPEMIEGGKNGWLVPPGEPKEISSKIKELLDNDHQRQEFGLQAHQTVLFKFGLDKMVKEIEETL